MCTMWIDGFNGVGHHLAQNVDFVIAAAADPPPCATTPATGTFKYDLLNEDADGKQDSTISVFTRVREGTLRHVYSAHPWMAE